MKCFLEFGIPPQFLSSWSLLWEVSSSYSPQILRSICPLSLHQSNSCIPPENCRTWVTTNDQCLRTQVIVLAYVATIRAFGDLPFLCNRSSSFLRTGREFRRPAEVIVSLIAYTLQTLPTAGNRNFSRSLLLPNPEWLDVFGIWKLLCYHDRVEQVSVLLKFRY